MATLLTNAQDAELLALMELYRGTSATPQGLVPEDVVRRMAKVLTDAITTLGFTYQLQNAIEGASQRPWLFWAALVNILDLAATGYVFQVEANWEFWENVLLPSLRDNPPERPMGLPDSLATEVAKALKELPGLESDMYRGSGLTVLEAIKQAPLPLWLEVIRNINANYTF